MKNIEKGLALNLYFIDLKSNVENIMRVFAEIFFTLRRFPGTIDHLPIIPTGNNSFVKESDIILPSWLYQNFNYGDTRGLASVHF